MGESKRKPVRIGFLGTLLVLPLILLLGLLSIPYGLIAVFYLRIKFQRTRRRLKALNRTLEWDEVERHLRVGEGTLIIEQANKVGARLWWTPDDCVNSGPPAIRDVEGLDISYVTGKSSDPFIAWCARYVSVNEGKAFLTVPNQIKFPPGPLRSDFLLGFYPQARIVQTLLSPENW